VAEWTKKYWDRVPFVIYPPVSMVELTNSDRNPYKIISVGRFMSRKSGHSKNQIELVKAFAKLSKKSDLPWELHLVGGVSKNQQKYFEKVARLSIGLNVTLHPNVSREVLLNLYSTSSIYWHAAGFKQPKTHPERFEHFGITVVEAMSSGLIPIVFHLGGPAEILGDYPELLYRSIPDLLNKTLGVSTSEITELRMEMKNMAKEYSSEYFYENALQKIHTLDNSQI
jgi:glycosyltransferase involved in cell wall biosynthesis